jgi:hypothetical protein
MLRTCPLSKDAATMHTPRTLSGRCLCGQVEYTVRDDFRYALNCHCSQCRRGTGSAFKPFGGIEVEHFRVTRGAEHLMRQGDDQTHDARCRHCGAWLYSLVRDAAWIHVTYGTLDQAPSLRPTAHIFVGSKAPWYDILDDLPQHAEFG